MRGRRQVKAQNLPSSGGVHAGGDDDRDVALNDLLESRSYTTSADSNQGIDILDSVGTHGAPDTVSSWTV